MLNLPVIKYDFYICRGILLMFAIAQVFCTLFAFLTGLAGFTELAGQLRMEIGLLVLPCLQALVLQGRCVNRSLDCGETEYLASAALSVRKLFACRNFFTVLCCTAIYLISLGTSAAAGIWKLLPGWSTGQVLYLYLTCWFVTLAVNEGCFFLAAKYARTAGYISVSALFFGTELFLYVLSGSAENLKFLRYGTFFSVLSRAPEKYPSFAGFLLMIAAFAAAAGLFYRGRIIAERRGGFDPGIF